MTRYAGLLLAGATLLHAQQLNLMPWPAKVEMGQGSLAIGPTLRVAMTGYSEPRLENAVRRLGRSPTDASAATLVVQCDHASHPVQQLGEDESYHLEITQQQAALIGAESAGRAARPGNISTVDCLHGAGSRSTGGRHSRPSAFPLARTASGCLAALDAHRSGQAQSRRHGRGEAERLPLASIGRPGLSRREQAFSEIAAARFRWALLHAGPNSRRDRIRARSRHSRGA